MKSKLGYLNDVASLACLLLGLLLVAQEHGWIPGPPTPDPAPQPDPDPKPNPDPEPKPPKPVESPFPAEGFWLLVTSQGEDPAKLVVNTQTIRNWDGLEARWHDYDQTSLEQPWQAALDWAERKGGSGVYYVARHGNKASEGTLTGSVDQMYQTVTKALEELK